MEQYVGLDVSLKETFVCVVDACGEVVCEKSVGTTPETITRSCGNQTAYQSLINRRLMVSPPAVRDSLEPSSNRRCRGRTKLPTSLENGHQREPRQIRLLSALK